METLTSDTTLHFAKDAAVDGFFFMSPWRGLAAKGCFTRVSTPAYDGHVMNSAFQQEILQRFRQAKQQGIEHPRLVGAIPFNPRQPSALYIPEVSHFFDSPSLRRHSSSSVARANDVENCIFTPGKSAFMQNVARGIAATSGGMLHKVVLARLIKIVTRYPIDTASLMEQLILQNPQSYHFCVPLAEGGTLAGASPELLLRMYGNRYYSHPLAGSASREQNQEQDKAAGKRLLNSKKDRYEHQLVVDAIRNMLQPHSHALLIPAQPQLTTTATLWHLGTPVKGKIRDKTATALSLACLLHPTPALSGFPHTLATKLIAELEPFDRGLFGGIVGWCDADGNGEWAVTIRCGKISNNRACLFAGAGIVPDSDPESEWNETSSKLDTLLRAMGLNEL